MEWASGLTQVRIRDSRNPRRWFFGVLLPKTSRGGLDTVLCHGGRVVQGETGTAQVQP